MNHLLLISNIKYDRVRSFALKKWMRLLLKSLLLTGILLTIITSSNLYAQIEGTPIVYVGQTEGYSVDIPSTGCVSSNDRSVIWTVTDSEFNTCVDCIGNGENSSNNTFVRYNWRKSGTLTVTITANDPADGGGDTRSVSSSDDCVISYSIYVTVENAPFNPCDDLPELPVDMFLSPLEFCSFNIDFVFNHRKDDFLTECEDFQLRKIDYRVSRGGSLIREGSIANPSTDGNIIYNQLISNLPNADNYSVDADITYSCGSCTTPFKEFRNVTVDVDRPEVDIVIDQSDVTSCSMNFSYTPNFEEENGCYVVKQLWNFGDGTTSTQQSPIHEYGAETSETNRYYGSLKIYYKCPSCTEELDGIQEEEFIFDIPNLLSSQLILDQTPKQLNVISNGATTFSSSWPTIIVTNDDQVQNMHPYRRGVAGVWRPEGSHVYNTSDVARTGSINKNLSIDGTYSTTLYDWKSSIADALPNWLKANTITAYNTESQEIENKDVLDVYTSSIYGHGGNLPIAAGNNMANREMGFTSFEDLGTVSGNFIFGGDNVNIPITLPVESGRSNILVIDQEIEIVSSLLSRDDVVTIITGEHAVETTILCVGVDDIDGTNPYPGKTIVILRERVNGSNEVFYNATLIKNKNVNGNVAVLSSEWAHSGDKSLLINTESNSNTQKFKQQIFQLLPNRVYSLYGWASTKANDVFYPSGKIAENVEIAILIDGVEVAKAELDGPIIEGWQSLKGSFSIPPNGYDLLELEFKTGSASLGYFDDIRIFPLDGNMQGFVYDSQLRLSATLDENNYATYYDYDGENNLFLVRKETVRGIKTIQQSTSNQKGPQ